MTKRWRVKIAYLREDGPEIRTLQIEELEELQEIVEQGYSFESILGIGIAYGLAERVRTVEETERD